MQAVSIRAPSGDDGLELAGQRRTDEFGTHLATMRGYVQRVDRVADGRGGCMRGEGVRADMKRSLYARVQAVSL